MSNKSDTVLLHSSIKAARQLQQSQIGKLQVRCDEDGALFETFREYARRRADIEQDYAQKLEKLSKALAARRSVAGKEKGGSGAAGSSAPSLAANSSAPLSPFSSLPTSPAEGEQSQSLPVPASPAVASASKRRTAQAFQVLLAATEKQAKARLTISEKFTTDFSDFIRNFNKEKAVSFKKQAEHVATMQEDMWKSFAELEKTRKIYEETEKLAEQARIKYDNEVKRPNSTLKTLTNIVKNRDAVTHSENLRKKWNGAVNRLDNARNEYLLQLDAVNAQMNHYYSTGLPAVLKRIDGSYYTSFTSLLQRISSMETDYSKTMIEDMQNISATAARINRDEEAEAFFNDQKAVLGKPKPFSFDAVGSDEVKDIVIDEFSKIVLSQKLGNLVVRQSALQNRLVQKEKERQGFKQMADAYQARPEFGDAGNPVEKMLDVEQACDLMRNELSRIQVQVERIKSHGVEPTIPEGAVVEEMPPEGVNATAILDYDPLAEGEVALTKGAKVLILEQEKGGWVKVDNNGTIGIIPATHVKADVPAEPAQGSSLTVAPAPASTPRAGTGGEEVKALYDYTAKETPSGGLSFKAGDVIEITSRDVNVEGDDQEWWSGTCLRTGESGKFPSMFVEAKANTGQTGIARSPSKAESLAQRKVMRAVYDYDESCPGELSFRRGDLIEVLDTTISTDWWEGRNTKTGRTGQFPTAYVEDPSAAALASNPTEPSRRASSEALAPAATATPVAVVTAAYDYEAQAEEELSFRRGDAINVISKTVPGDDSGGWWLGEKGGSVGEIPASYVEQEV